MIPYLTAPVVPFSILSWRAGLAVARPDGRHPARPRPVPKVVHAAEGADRAAWRPRAVAAFPPSAGSQRRAAPVLPVHMATRGDGRGVGARTSARSIA